MLTPPATGRRRPSEGRVQGARQDQEDASLPDDGLVALQHVLVVGIDGPAADDPRVVGEAIEDVPAARVRRELGIGQGGPSAGCGGVAGAGVVVAIGRVGAGGGPVGTDNGRH